MCALKGERKEFWKMTVDLPQWLTADTNYSINQTWVGEAADNLLDVFLLLGLWNLVLSHDQISRLAQHVANLVMDCLVLQALKDVLLAR